TIGTAEDALRIRIQQVAMRCQMTSTFCSSPVLPHSVRAVRRRLARKGEFEVVFGVGEPLILVSLHVEFKSVEHISVKFIVRLTLISFHQVHLS
ncbi:hypothetical protein PFISCL1PPCAC_3357, partial [Pristionchus fissidentatus]